MPEMILLETEAYVRLGLNFENPKLLKLIELVRAGDVELLITEVIRKEVEADLYQRAGELWNKCKELTHDIERKGAAGGFASLKAALAEVSEQGIQEALLDVFKAFQDRAEVKEIPTPTDLVPKLLNDYFTSTPPFGAGKKRKEFPDAISLYAASGFADKKNRTITIISGDPDIKKGCDRFPRLRSVDGVEEVMAEIIGAQTLLESTVKNVRTFLSKPPPALFFDIAESFERLGFYWAGGRQGDLVEVYDIEVKRLRDGVVLGVDADWVLATASADIKFSAETSLENSFTWVEDYPRQRGSRADDTLNREIGVDVDIQLRVDPEGQVQHWRIIQVNNGNDVAIS